MSTEMPQDGTIAIGFERYDIPDTIDKGNGRGLVRTALYNRLDEIKRHVESTGDYGVVFKVKFFANHNSAATAARQTTQSKGDRSLPTLEGARWEGRVRKLPHGSWYCVVIHKAH